MVTPVSSATAPSVVCAAFRPSRKSLSRIGREQVGRLMPLRIPAAADLHAALVLAHADRRHDVHERRRVGVGHVRTDLRRVVGRVLLVGGVEEPGELLRLGHLRRGRLELDVHVGFGPLLGAASSRRRAACRGRTASCRAESCRATSAPDSGREPGGSSLPCSSLALLDVGAARRSVRSPRCSTARSGSSARSCTSGMLKTRASSITSAVPEPSSLAASPQPCPSMWALTMYISFGSVRADLRAVTPPRGHRASPAPRSARAAPSFGCFIGSVLTPVGVRMPRGRPPPTARVTASDRRSGGAAGACRPAAAGCRCSAAARCGQP